MKIDVKKIFHEKEKKNEKTPRLKLYSWFGGSIFWEGEFFQEMGESIENKAGEIH